MIVGTVFEFFDFMIFMQLLFVVTPLFFPVEEPFLATLLSMISLCVSFLMRPLGGVLLGIVGDRQGRKSVLSLSMILMTIPTLIIGILPTYETIGIFAPIILLLCRLVQGFSVGGEVNMANIFLVESAPKNQKCFFGSLLNSAAFTGGLIGALFGFIATLSSMPPWMWRVPFLFGSLIGFLGFFVRRKISDAPEFLNKRQSQKTELRKEFDFSWANIKNGLCILGLSAGVAIPTNLTFVYIVSLMKGDEGHNVYFTNAIVMFCIVLLQPIFGALGDKIGSRKLISFTSLLILIFSLLYLKFFPSTLKFENLFILQLIIMCMASGISAPVCSYLVSLFPVLQRGKWLGFCWSLGLLIFNFSSTFCLYMSQCLGDFTPIALCLGVCGLSTYIGLYFSKPSHERNDSEEILLNSLKQQGTS